MCSYVLHSYNIISYIMLFENALGFIRDNINNPGLIKLLTFNNMFNVIKWIYVTYIHAAL